MLRNIKKCFKCMVYIVPILAFITVIERHSKKNFQFFLKPFSPTNYRVLYLNYYLSHQVSLALGRSQTSKKNLQIIRILNKAKIIFFKEIVSAEKKMFFLSL